MNKVYLHFSLQLNVPHLFPFDLVIPSMLGVILQENCHKDDQILLKMIWLLCIIHKQNNLVVVSSNNNYKRNNNSYDDDDISLTTLRNLFFRGACHDDVVV